MSKLNPLAELNPIVKKEFNNIWSLFELINIRLAFNITWLPAYWFNLSGAAVV